MPRHEKKAFFKFFLIYFLSVAILILVAGFFYFSQMKNQFLKAEQFSMIEYARDIKMGKDLSKFSGIYRHGFSDNIYNHIDIENFATKDGEFVKFIPLNKLGNYFQVFKSTAGYEQKLFNLKLRIAFVQLILLILFALLSHRLAKNALLPLEESIATLDKFAKDLIHDLNTPVTSIKLNMKLLKKDPNFKDNKALHRLNRSVYTISELHENLTILLQEETFQMQEVNLFDIVKDIVQTQKQIYPHLDFIVENSVLKAKVNPNAMKQILQNIVSNACKYNSKDGFIKVYADKNSLCVEDSGKGIKEPERIFERSFSEKNSSGIGLDIVMRLAKSMDIGIRVKSTPKGTIFTLSF
ncbi:MAG: HAMP domain-containing sensor histidine kinase [Sulfurospirillum sp.]